MIPQISAGTMRQRTYAAAGALLLSATAPFASGCADLTAADYVRVGASTYGAANPGLDRDQRSLLGAIGGLAGAAAAHQRAKESAPKIDIHNYNPRPPDAITPTAPPLPEPPVDWDRVLLDPRVKKVAGRWDWVVFALEYGGNSELYFANKDGTGVQRLTYTPDLNETDPRWVNGGDDILYTAKMRDDSRYIFQIIMHRDGTRQRRIDFSSIMGSNDLTIASYVGTKEREIWSLSGIPRKLFDYETPLDEPPSGDRRNFHRCFVDGHIVTAQFAIGEGNRGFLKVHAQNVGNPSDIRFIESDQTFYDTDSDRKIMPALNVEPNGQRLKMQLVAEVRRMKKRLFAGPMQVADFFERALDYDVREGSLTEAGKKRF